MALNFKDKFNSISGYVPFPDIFADDSEKETEEFGLRFGKAIESEWFQADSGNKGRYQTSRDWYNMLRSYARGEQSMDNIQKLLGIKDNSTNGNNKKGRKLYTNYDTRPIQVVPKLVKHITNQMGERLFDLSVDAIDEYSQSVKKQKRDDLDRLRVSKSIIEDSREMLGVDLAPGMEMDDIPQTTEEVNLRMNMSDKLGIEIAEEEAINFSLGLSEYDEVSNRVTHDLVILGKGAVKHETDLDRGVIAKYVDPADLVHSYPTHRNYSDVNYFGEIKHMNATEVQRLSGDIFTNEELRKMTEAHGQYPSYYGYSNDNYYRDQDLPNTKIVVLHFTFEANNHITFKKKYNKNGGFKMIKKDGDFKKKSEDYNGYEAKRSYMKVWYEGYLVLGTDYIFNYGVCKNMVRPKGDLRNPLPPYIVYSPDLYQNRPKSIVGTIIPYVDQLQQIYIKTQQFIAKSKPPGIEIDISAIESIDLGDGNNMSLAEYIRFVNETGDTIKRSINEEGEYNIASNPIRNIPNGFMGGLNELIVSFNHYMNLIRDAIGIPLGADASTPHPDMAVGIQHQLALNSNTATKHILEGNLNITQRLCTALSLRLSDIVKYPNLRSAYERGIGRYNVEVIESLKELSLRDFAIFVNLKPDFEEKQKMQSAIQIALQGGLITLSDAIDIEQIDNIKLASQVLKINIEKRQKQAQKEREKEIMLQGEANAISAERVAQAKMQESQFQAEADIASINAKTQGRIAELQEEARLKQELMAQEFDYNIQLKGIEVGGKRENEKMKEDEKTKRQDRNNTQHSAIIDQRTTDSSPLNFESNEDHLSGSIGFDDVGNF